ncbi:hypothetical protein FRC08_012617 [Ceratobasidium sp. 394]|nr:hypothetical protein FRC08_012617 [Ceratobasidium sp. 394]
MLRLMSANVGARRALARLAPHNALVRPAFSQPALLFAVRGMANKIPTDENKEPDSVLHSAKEELKHVGGDLAKTIAGNVSRDVPEEARKDAAAVTRELAGSSKIGHGGIKEDFISITKEIAETVPSPALKMGLAGGVPYIGTSLATLYYSRELARAASGAVPGLDVNATLETLHQLQHVQVTYGAVLLGFLGAIHWGMEFAQYGGEHGYKRLALGVAPVLYAWPTLYLSPEVALATQWAGFTALWYADSKATTAGWTPKWYSQYRFYLSILVGTCIIGTLAGTNVLGPASSTHVGAQPHTYAKNKHVSKGAMGGLATKGGRKGGELSADSTEGIEAVLGDEGSDAYVVIKKKDKPQEGEDDKNQDVKEGAKDTKDEGTQEAQAKKDEGQTKGKAGQVRQGETKNRT